MANSITHLTKRFKEVAQQVGTMVFISPRSSQRLSRLLTSIVGMDSKVIIADFRFLEEALLSDFKQSISYYNPSPDDDEMESAGFGITDSFAGVANTGSVCVVNDASMSGSFSLFPKKHIVLLDSQKIVSRPRDVFLNDSLSEITLGEDFVFISGPSATADMGPLVRGVHGPEKLYVIILE